MSEMGRSQTSHRLHELVLGGLLTDIGEPGGSRRSAAATPAPDIATTPII
jgi:hypothetical protein